MRPTPEMFDHPGVKDLKNKDLANLSRMQVLLDQGDTETARAVAIKMATAAIRNYAIILCNNHGLKPVA